jgi:hypothetical protein
MIIRNALLLVAALGVSSATLMAQEGPKTVALGDAGQFAVLGATTVTNTGDTVVAGNLGVAPGTAVTGFLPIAGGPGKVDGTIYTPDQVCSQTSCVTEPNTQAALGQAALLVAYNDAKGRTKNSINVDSENLAGKTLAPGLYKSTSGLSITGGDVTLSGDGVYIFQVASTLTVNDDSRVVLTDGAVAANVFWQVGSSATLFGSSSVAGTILAHTSVSIDTAAILNGRALALNGAVTLQDNAITRPPLKTGPQ